MGATRKERTVSHRYNSAPVADELVLLHLVFYDYYNMLDASNHDIYDYIYNCNNGNYNYNYNCKLQLQL